MQRSHKVRFPIVDDVESEVSQVGKVGGDPLHIRGSECAGSDDGQGLQLGHSDEPVRDVLPLRFFDSMQTQAPDGRDDGQRLQLELLRREAKVELRQMRESIADDARSEGTPEAEVAQGISASAEGVELSLRNGVGLELSHARKGGPQTRGKLVQLHAHQGGKLRERVAMRELVVSDRGRNEEAYSHVARVRRRVKVSGRVPSTGIVRQPKRVRSEDCDRRVHAKNRHEGEVPRSVVGRGVMGNGK